MNRELIQQLIIYFDSKTTLTREEKTILNKLENQCLEQEENGAK